MLKMHKFDLLVALYIFCIMVAELMGAKTFPIGNIFGFQLNASVAIFVIPLIFTINDIITEVHGRERARSVIQSGMLIIFLVLVVSLLFTFLPSSTRFAPSEEAYDDVFGKSARIAAASLTAFTIAGFLDVYIFSRLRERMGKHALWLRNNVSNFVSQLFDTSIFIFLAFYAFERPFDNNFVFLIGLIIPYWLLKCFMSVIETPFVYAGVKWLRSEKDNSIVDSIKSKTKKK